MRRRESAGYGQGYPFLMEKPMGLNAGEVLSVAEKAEAKGAFAAVPFFMRNLGLHGLDMFLHLMGEGARVTGAQISARALGRDVEDYASVLLQSESCVLATVEVGNIFPQITAPQNLETAWVGTDAEYKLSGSDALLTFKDGVLRVTTKETQELVPFTPGAPPAFRILEDTLARWQRGEAPLASARDCFRAVELADAAYKLAG